MSVNKVTLLGRLGGDPDVRTTANGTPVAAFSLATSEIWYDENKKKQERTEWHKCVAWRKTAENVGKYLKKGSQVYIEGKLQTRQWEKEGEKRSVTEIIVDNIQFTGSGGGGGAPHPASSDSPDPRTASVTGKSSEEKSRVTTGYSPAGSEPFPDDLPF